MPVYQNTSIIDNAEYESQSIKVPESPFLSPTDRFAKFNHRFDR